MGRNFDVPLFHHYTLAGIPRDPVVTPTLLALGTAAATGAGAAGAAGSVAAVSTGLAGALTPAMLGLTAAGGLISAGGTILGGNAKKASLDYRAAQLDQEAVQTRAAAQRKSMETGLKTTYALSSLQAKSAASGGGATDTGVLDLAGNIAGRGEYQSLADMYQGENAARGLEDEATGDRYTGNADAEGGDLAGAGTILSTGGSMFKEYGEFTNPYYRGRTV